MPKAKVEEEVENIAIPEDAEDNEPVYYSPKALSLVSAIAAWVSWIALAGFVLVVAAQIQYINSIAVESGATLASFMTDPQQGAQVRNFIYTNTVLPLLTGVGLFVLLQAASIGLNALLEIDFNMREPKN